MHCEASESLEEAVSTVDMPLYKGTFVKLVADVDVAVVVAVR